MYDTSFDHNGNGLYVISGKATVTDSSAYYNFVGFESQDTLTLFNVRMLFNNYGMVVTPGGTLSIARCVVSNNANAYLVAPEGSLAGTSPGTSLIAPGQATSGTLSTAIVLQ